MHLGNEAVTLECALLAGGMAASGLAFAGGAARKSPISREKLLLAGALGSLVFAAQAVNVPILPGISAHLVGGVLLAWALGPALGSLTMAVVLAVQAIALGDGGLIALGANVLNMALLPAGMVSLSQRFAGGSDRTIYGCLIASCLAAASVPAAALLLVGETALFRSPAELVGWTDFAARMIASHAWIGVFEGGLTFALVLALHWSLDLNGQYAWRLNLTWMGAAIAMAAAAVYVSSARPDGYEAAAAQSGLAHLLSNGPGVIAVAQAKLTSGLAAFAGQESTLLIASTLATGCLVAAFVAALRRGAAIGSVESC